MYNRRQDYLTYASYAAPRKRSSNPRQRTYQPVTIDEMISSLHRANFTTGRKAILGSKPRIESEQEWRSRSQVQLDPKNWRGTSGKHHKIKTKT